MSFVGQRAHLVTPFTAVEVLVGGEIETVSTPAEVAAGLSGEDGEEEPGYLVDVLQVFLLATTEV
jgi:hypothetical protein